MAERCSVLRGNALCIRDYGHAGAHLFGENSESVTERCDYQSDSIEEGVTYHNHCWLKLGHKGYHDFPPRAPRTFTAEEVRPLILLLKMFCMEIRDAIERAHKEGLPVVPLDYWATDLYRQATEVCEAWDAKLSAPAKEGK